MEQAPQTINAFTGFYQVLISKPEYITTGLFLIILIIFLMAWVLDRRTHKAFVDTVMDKNDKREERYIEREERYIGLINGPLSMLPGLCTDVRQIKDELASKGDVPK
jgi:hypothetical protein